MSSRTRSALFVAACCIATFALKLWANGERVNAGHGDTAYYLHVAQNLFAGRGFVCDYVWSFLENPTGVVPAPSHAWWMPGPTIVAWIGMVIAGAASYAAAKTAMAALTSLTPAVVWWTARTVSTNPALAARATLLSVAFHPFIDQPAAPLSHGPYGMIVGAALVWLAAAPLTAGRGAVFGALIALGHYFRGDALTLFGTAAALMILLRRGGNGLRGAAVPLAAAVAAYLIVMAPWFARNMMVFGRPLAAGPSKAVYLRDYYDWFALPDRLTREKYLADGWGILLKEKWDQILDALGSYFTSYYDPTLPVPPPAHDVSLGSSLKSLWVWLGNPHADFPAPAAPPWYVLRQLSYVMAVLTFAGIARLAATAWRASGAPRRLAVFGLHSLAELVFYAVLFTGVANQSYVSSLYSLYPLFVVGIAAGVEWPARLAASHARGASRFAWAMILLITVGNAVGVCAYLRAYKGPEYSKLYSRLHRFGERLVKEGFDPSKDKLMIINTWNLYDAKPLPIMRIPDEPLPKIIRKAARSGVTWLAVNDRPKEISQAARAYRLQLYDVLTMKDMFTVVFRDSDLRLNAVKILPAALQNLKEPAPSSGPETKPAIPGSDPAQGR